MTQGTEFIRLSISTNFVMILVPARVKIQGNSDTLLWVKVKVESYL